MPQLQPQPAPTAEDWAFSRLIAYAAYQWPGYKDARHHRMIARKLEAVERGEITRLMIFMPPRHGKSMLASEFFPAWYMGRNPDHYVVAATYGQDLADDFGRKVKNQISDGAYGQVFPGVGLADDSRSSKRFHIQADIGGYEHQVSQGGAYYAVGVGGPLTGRGAHLLLIDDPIKDRESADSEITRKRIKDWYTSTAYTRLMKGGRVVVIQCMVGGTPVLMADGTEKALRDVRRGDKVATYDAGRLTTARVLNWINHGADSVYEIRTTSGKIVKANERHPFLVERDGERKWIRVRALAIGDKVLRLTGASGRASSAHMTDASGQPAPLAFATHTTTKPNGPAGIVRRLASRILRLASAQSSSTDTASASMSTSRFLRLREAFAQSVCVLPRTHATQPIGTTCSASTTATTQRRFAVCSATTATLQSGEPEQPRCSKPPRNTSDFTADEILSIEPAGREDVFDIQVEGTENFIANGLVSHNTRWHEDDLAGWLIDHHAGEGWDVLNLPAIGPDGSALWPEQYDEESLARIKSAVGPRDWSALYQQSPSPDEGTYFQRDWFKEWTIKPANLSIYGTSDYAVTDGGGDWTVHRIWGVDPAGDLYRLAGWRGQTSADVWIDRKLDLMEEWKPFAWFGEAGVIQKAIEPMLRRRMLERQVFCRMEWLSSISDKPTRARGFQARAAMGKVWFERDADISEFLKFPAGTHDDDVDTASMIGRALDEAHPATVPVKEQKPYIDRWDKAFNEDRETESDWKTA